MQKPDSPNLGIDLQKILKEKEENDQLYESIINNPDSTQKDEISRIAGEQFRILNRRRDNLDNTAKTDSNNPERVPDNGISGEKIYTERFNAAKEDLDENLKGLEPAAPGAASQVDKAKNVARHATQLSEAQQGLASLDQQAIDRDKRNFQNLNTELQKELQKAEEYRATHRTVDEQAVDKFEDEGGFIPDTQEEDVTAPLEKPPEAAPPEAQEDIGRKWANATPEEQIESVKFYLSETSLVGMNLDHEDSIKFITSTMKEVLRELKGQTITGIKCLEGAFCAAVMVDYRNNEQKQQKIVIKISHKVANDEYYRLPMHLRLHGQIGMLRNALGEDASELLCQETTLFNDGNTGIKDPNGLMHEVAVQKYINDPISESTPEAKQVFLRLALKLKMKGIYIDMGSSPTFDECNSISFDSLTNRIRLRDTGFLASNQMPDAGIAWDFLLKPELLGKDVPEGFRFTYAIVCLAKDLGYKSLSDYLNQGFGPGGADIKIAHADILFDDFFQNLAETRARKESSEEVLSRVPEQFNKVITDKGGDYKEQFAKIQDEFRDRLFSFNLSELRSSATDFFAEMNTRVFKAAFDRGTQLTNFSIDKEEWDTNRKVFIRYEFSDGQVAKTEVPKTYLNDATRQQMT
jgi:hypothetical protein